MQSLALEIPAFCFAHFLQRTIYNSLLKSRKNGHNMKTCRQSVKHIIWLPTIMHRNSRKRVWCKKSLVLTKTEPKDS
ncbi:hypothetical protein CW304_21175 [Bacillus sp. UFRGS-B20]|nr:hypothetical protein CW304_21175 [Bacillus sp. UFRGS-B20]